MSPTFEPPTVADVPRTLPDTKGPAHRLFRWCSPHRRGHSILKNHDGTYTQVDNPTQLQMDAAVLTYLGGHIYNIDAAEAAALIAAGYIVHTTTWNDLTGVRWDDLTTLDWATL